MFAHAAPCKIRHHIRTSSKGHPRHMSRQHNTVWSGAQYAALHQSVAQRLQRVPSPHESETYNNTVAVWNMREKRYSDMDRKSNEFHMWSLREIFQCVRGGRVPLVLSSIYGGYLIGAVMFLGLPSTSIGIMATLLGDAQTLFNVASVFATPLFFMLSMRINRAVKDRWWAGRQVFGRVLSGGLNLVNAAQLYIKDHVAAVEVGVLSVALVRSVECHLRDISGDKYYPTFQHLLQPLHMEQLLMSQHKPHYMIEILSQTLADAFARGDIHNVRCLIAMQQVIQDLVQDIEYLSRIRNTPEPWAYQKHLRFVIMIWLAFLPFCLIPSIGVATVPIGMTFGYVVLKLDSVSVELQNPFGLEYTDHNICILADRFQSEMHEMLHRYLERLSKSSTGP